MRKQPSNFQINAFFWAFVALCGVSLGGWVWMGLAIAEALS